MKNHNKNKNLLMLIFFACVITMLLEQKISYGCFQNNAQNNTRATVSRRIVKAPQTEVKIKRRKVVPKKASDAVDYKKLGVEPIGFHYRKPEHWFGDCQRVIDMAMSLDVDRLTPQACDFLIQKVPSLIRALPKKSEFYPRGSFGAELAHAKCESTIRYMKHLEWCGLLSQRLRTFKAMLLYRQGNQREAFKTLTESLSQPGNNWQIHTALAEYWLRSDHRSLRNAYEHATMAIRLHPGKDVGNNLFQGADFAHYYRAKVFRISGEFEKARLDLHKACEIRPKHDLFIRELIQVENLIARKKDQHRHSLTVLDKLSDKYQDKE